ncbi:trehalose-6-phosphate hydrolase [Vibrio cholerae]|nr:trehalose-6-phosphate hydrolase [Vibrio cholerae]
MSRLGDDQQYRVESAKMLAATIHLMQGTPYIYQGEEIGMTNPGFTSIKQYRDVESINIHQIMVQQQGVSESDMLAILAQKSRDNSRTPMQWDASLNAGFTRGEPWIEVAHNYPEINAQAALEDPHSVFYFYRRLLSLRKKVAVITDGDYTDLLPEHKEIFAYQRRNQKQVLICLNNYYGHEAECVLPELPLDDALYLLGNYPGIELQRVLAHQVLRPYETRIILIESPL